MTTAALRARAPRQLDIIADTALAAEFKSPVVCQPKPGQENTSGLSTEPPAANTSGLSTIKDIDRRRKELGLSHEKLCQAADIQIWNWYRLLRGAHHPRPSTIKKLEQTLDRFAVGYAPLQRLTVGEKCLRELMIDIAVRLDLDPESVLAQDYSSEKTNDEAYMRNCNVRRYAVYLMIEGMGFPKAGVARVAGFSRQAAHKTVTAIECRRESDAALDKLLGDMMLKVSGKRL